MRITTERRDRVLLGVAHEYGVSTWDILSDRRFRRWVHARQAAMAAFEAQGFTSPEIARVMNRNHTTVAHGVRAHAARVGV